MFRRLLSGVALTLLTASSLPAQDWARKLLATSEHDFGSVARGAKAEYAFIVTNNLQDDVHIASVRSSCGCTSPYVENDKRTLKTYEKGAIIAHLNSDTHIGQRAATLTVTFDRPYYAEVQLQIRALVHTDILMEPASLQFGTVELGQAKEARARLYRADYPNWQIQSSVHLSDPNLQGEVILLARQGSQVWYDLKVRLAPTATSGYISDHAVLMTNDPSMRQMVVQVEGQVRPNVVVSPADLFLGVMHIGEKVTKPLVVRADKPFRIKSITSDKAEFVIPNPPGDAKLVHVVPVTFVAGAEVGKVVKTIHIETDIGGAQATSYAVVNEVK
ncbi:MAG: DUF1573 domain-containing protein [Thermoguttaceae bacterium]|jgi:hypothetical protein